MPKIPIIICIDVEPDEREIDCKLAKDWEGFEHVFKSFTNVRCRLEEVTGAPANFSWFLRMDPQVKHTYGLHGWVTKRYGDAIRMLEQSRDELGLHTHAWRWDDSLLRWVIDHGDQKWVEHCVQVSFDAFQDAFGRPCRSFRFGEHWMNNETMDLIERRGVDFELTVEPGRGSRPSISPWELHTGSFPDYTTAPSWPYRPSRQDFRTDKGGSKRGLWMIPLSTEKMPGRFQSLKQAAMALGYDYRKNHEPIPLDLCLDVTQFRPMVNNLIELKGQPYLAPVLRSASGLIPGSQASLEQNLNVLLSHPLANDFQFVTPAEAINILTRQHQPDKAASAQC
jgi:hypothetical protein